MRTRPAQWILLLALSATGWASVCRSATLRVALDGTGDYETLQGALDAAVEGDTIRLGPGRYDQFAERSLVNGTVRQLVAVVSTPNLTIEGEDRDAVRIGPAVLTQTLDGMRTGGIVVDAPAVGTTVRWLTAENCDTPAVTGSRGTTWESVSILSGFQSGLECLGANDLVIRDSFFEGSGRWEIWVTMRPEARNILIEGCTVRTASGRGIDIGTAKQVTVRDCVFELDVPVGVSLVIWNGAQAVVERCRLMGVGGAGLFVGINTDVELTDNVFASGSLFTLEIDSGFAHGTGNYFGGATFATIDMSGNTGAADLQYGTIERLEGLSVRAQAGGAGTGVIDLRHNFWGTADSTQIEEWIFDKADVSSDSPMARVLFMPILDRSVRTEASSMGALKGMFVEPR